MIFSLFVWFLGWNIAVEKSTNFPIFADAKQENEKNIVILSLKFEVDNPEQQARKLLAEKFEEPYYSCGNQQIFGLPADHSVVETEKTAFIFAENMASGDVYHCVDNAVVKYGFWDFANENIFLTKTIFADASFQEYRCEGKNDEFFSMKKWLDDAMHEGNSQECKAICTEYQQLQHK